ncbi:MAG: ergothioneine biosynthesis protein EgtB [Gemmatimonadales bacterium]
MDFQVATLADHYRAIRATTDWICQPLATEDFVVQSMPEASPTRWHLAHTTWFFETFILKPVVREYRPFDPHFEYLFNSYYNAVGPQPFRLHRGLLTRPSVAEVQRYRGHVDVAMLQLLERGGAGPEVVVLGLNHEQQHQELIVTDLKHLLSCNPLRPVYREIVAPEADVAPQATWVDGPAGLIEIGFGGEGFAFDNESPRHQVFMDRFQVGHRLVTCGEFREFMADGGYRRPELWLSDGWNTVRDRSWTAPLYWERRDGDWWAMTLAGMRPVAAAEPVTHVSFYEADAFARWAGARLPTEMEWEAIAAHCPVDGHFLEAGHFHPVPIAPGAGVGVSQLYGDVWQWTRSAYGPYPRYRPVVGALGEYNAKFMCNQIVLRGASCVTPRSHARPTYRNFFPPDARWQFSGIRLVRDS